MSTFKELIDNKKSLDWEKKLITRLNLAGKRIFFSKSDYPEITDLINSCTNSSIGRGEIVFYYFLSSLKYDIEENHSESNPDLKMNISEDDKLFFEVKLDRRNITYGSVSSFRGLEAIRDVRYFCWMNKQDRYYTYEMLVASLIYLRDLVPAKWKELLVNYQDLIGEEKEPKQIAYLFFRDCFRLLYEKKPGTGHFVVLIDDKDLSYIAHKIGFFEDLTLEKIEKCSPYIDGDRLVFNRKFFD